MYNLQGIGCGFILITLQGFQLTRGLLTISVPNKKDQMYPIGDEWMVHNLAMLCVSHTFRCFEADEGPTAAGAEPRFGVPW